MLADYAACVEDFYPDEPFVLADIKLDVLIQSDRPALMRPLNKPYIERIDFRIIAYFYRIPLVSVTRPAT